jgi:hypothetical protein
MDTTLEGRPERRRHHLRRPVIRRPPLTRKPQPLTPKVGSPEPPTTDSGGVLKGCQAECIRIIVAVGLLTLRFVWMARIELGLQSHGHGNVVAHVPVAPGAWS